MDDNPRLPHGGSSRQDHDVRTPTNVYAHNTDENMQVILEATRYLEDYVATPSPMARKKVLRVPVLIGAENWDAWKILAEKQLKSLRLDHTIKADAEIETIDQHLAYSHIISWVDTSLQRPISHHQTAQSAWNILCKTYDKKDFAQISEAITEWINIKRSDFDTLDDFFKGFHNRLAAVIDIGVTIPDEMCCVKFLQCVKEDLPSWTQSIMNSARNGYKPTLDKLMAEALDESQHGQVSPAQLATLRLAAVTSANKTHSKVKVKGDGKGK